MQLLLGFFRSAMLKRQFVLSIIVCAISGCGGSSRVAVDLEQEIESAFIALQNDNLDAAEEHLEKIKSESPGNAIVHLIGGEIATRRNDLPKALQRYEQIPVSDPHLGIQSATARAEILRTLGSVTAAENVYESILQYDQDHQLVRQRLGQLAMYTGRRDRAISFFVPLLKEGHSSQEMLGLIGTAELLLTNKEYLVRAQNAYPQDQLVALGLANWEVRRGTIKQARKWLAVAYETSPVPVGARLLQMKLDLLEHKERRFIEQAIEYQEELDFLPEYWIMLGEFCTKASRYEEAARSYWECLQRDPDRLSALNAIGKSLIRINKTDIAKPYLDRAQQVEVIRGYLTSVRLEDGAVPNLEMVKKIALQLESMSRLWEAAGWNYLALQTGSGEEWPQLALKRILPQLTPEVPLVLGSVSDRLSLKVFPLPELQNIDLATIEKKKTEPAEAKLIQPRFQDVALDVGIQFRYFESPDETTPGRRMFEVYGGGTGVLDFDADGWPDLYFPQGTEWPVQSNNKAYADQLYHNVKGDRFNNVTEKARIQEFSYSHGVAIGDYNQDGFDDIYVANVHQNTLFENQGDGTFLKSSAFAVSPDSRWTVSCGIADLNGDRLPDLYDVNYLAGPQALELICESAGYAVTCTPHAFPGASDQVWINLGDGRFADRTEALGIQSTDGKGLGLLISDLNHSGRNEIFVANDSVANSLYQPNQDYEYADQALLMGAAYDRDGLGQACMGIAAGDYNGDQWLDLFVTNYFNEFNALYLNREGTQLEDRSRESHLAEISYKQLGFGTQAIDYDDDGDLDLAVFNGDIDDFSFEADRPRRMRPLFHINSGQAQYVTAEMNGEDEYFSKPHVSRAAAVLDWNRDGKMDLIVSHLDGDCASLLTNRTENNQKAIQIKLIGRDSGRDLTGTRLIAKTQNKELYRQMTAGDGYACSNQKLLHFGLANASSIESLKVHWPSGKIQEIRNLLGDREYFVVEGRANPLPTPIEHKH